MITKKMLFQNLFLITLVATACSMMAMELPPTRSKSPVKLREAFDILNQSSLHELIQERQKEAAQTKQPFRELKIRPLSKSTFL
jgi:hypothetical protein